MQSLFRLLIVVLGDFFSLIGFAYAYKGYLIYWHCLIPLFFQETEKSLLLLVPRRACCLRCWVIEYIYPVFWSGNVRRTPNIIYSAGFEYSLNYQNLMSSDFLPHFIPLFLGSKISLAATHIVQLFLNSVLWVKIPKILLISGQTLSQDFTATLLFHHLQ